MQAEGTHERFYDLTAEINPAPWRFDAAYPAEFLTAEYAAKIQAICDGCHARYYCPDRGHDDAVDVCLILQDAL